MAAAVVNPTDKPFWHAASPNPRAMCVLPVPLLPRAMTFSRRVMYSQRASSRTKLLLSEGIAVKSKLSRLFTVGNRASFAALDCPPFPLDQFQFGQAQQVAGVVD